MRIKWVTPFITMLLATAGVASGEDATISGIIDLGGRVVHQSSSNSAKFQEYRDLNGKILGNVNLDLSQGSYYSEFSARDMGLDTQSYKLKGGSYGNFKYSLFYDEIPHNLSFGAQTFYTGVGSNNLTFTALPAAGTIPPNTFDYSIKRQNYGGAIEVSLNTPVYFSAGISEIKTRGVQPLGSGEFGAPGVGFMVELPAPVDYTSKTLNLETGYRTNNVVASIDGTLSQFENKNDFFTWRTPNSAGLPSTSTLAPDSNYYRIGGQVSAKLPMESRLALKGSYARLENNLLLSDAINTFNGDNIYTTASVALTSNPLKALDTKVYYNFLKKDNDSSILTFPSDAVHPNPFSNDLFRYKKHNAGLDVGYKLPMKSKLDAGYEFLYIDRERNDARSTTDHKLYVQLKNSYLDLVTAKIRYQHLERGTDFNGAADVDPANTDTQIALYQRRFDVTDKTQDMVKLGFDLTPAEHLDLGIEYAYKLDDYNKTAIGLQKDTRHEFIVDASYDVPNVVKLSGFFDYEIVRSDSFLRQFTNGGNPFPDSGTQNNTNFNWNLNRKDDNYAYGVTADVPVVKNTLNVVASWTYERANGETDFSTDGNPLVTKAFSNINNVDDYTKKVINAKAIYAVNKNLNLTLGYAYENYSLNDAELNGYTYVPSAGNYLSGAYSDHDYEAHVGYLTAAYKF